MPHKTIIRLSGVAQNPANGFPARPLGQHQRAIQDYGQFIQLDPNDAQAYANRGVSFHDMGQYQRAIEDFDQAIQLDLDLAEAYAGRALAYCYLGQQQKARLDWDRACFLDSKYCR